MGLFGSIFGGSSESQSSTNKTTTIRTTTTSRVGDIGLTGQNAVDIFKTFADVAKVNASSLATVAQESGKNYQQLVGGAGKLVETAPVMTGAAPPDSGFDFQQLLLPAALLIGGIMLYKYM